MVRQQLKDFYFSMVRWLTLPNYLLARLRNRRIEAKSIALHLGCGPSYVPGMINIDGNIFRKKELWLDLRNGLPFPTGSADFVYSSHTLEHLYPDEAIRVLREVHRVLKRGAVARIAVPSMEHALQIAAGNARCEWPRKFDGGLDQAANYLFCDGQHKYGYSFGILETFALSVGFEHVVNYSERHGCSPKQYGAVTVGDEYEGSLVVELVK